MHRIIGLGAAIALVIAAAPGCGGDGGSTGGSGGGGAGGGASITCLDGSAFADHFTIADTSYCAVAMYEADESLIVPATMVPQSPAWGSHGGPVWFVPDASGGGVTIERWTVPAGAGGKLTKQATHVDAKIPDGAFAGAQAIDLPFFGWTAISWTGAFPETKGKVSMIEGGAVASSFDVNGAFAMAAVGDASGGRLLYTGLSPIGMADTSANAFYGADACAKPEPDLGAGDGCSASAEIAAWGDSSGPVAVDRDGNAFVVLASFATGDQEARGFAKGEVARGAKAAAGSKLFTLPGFGSSLAAITPRAGAPGALVFQPFDSMATPLDVIAEPYVAGTSITAMGAPAKLLAMPAGAPVALTLFTDDADRLWVASTSAEATTFVVIARKP